MSREAAVADPGGRVAPSSIDAEVCVLGSMILDATSIDLVVQILREDRFHRSAHQKIFRALVEMHDRGMPIDLVLLKDELIRRRQLEQIGDTQYLVRLVEGVPTAANAEYYAQIVRDKAVLRQLIQTATEIARDAFDPTAEAEEVVQETEKRIFKITSDHVGKDVVFLDGLLQETFEDLEKHNGQSTTGVPSGYDRLDEMTRGFQGSEMIVVAARPSMGKTSLLLNFAEHMAIIEKQKVALFSLEMSQKQLALRFLASHARYDIRKMISGQVKPQEWTDLQLAAGNLQSQTILIDDSPELTMTQIRAKARRLKLQHDIQCVLIDYIQLIRPSGRAENRQVQVSEMSRGIKAMARELEIPVITAAQLNRGPTDRPVHRPRMSDLRESGAIEQDADVVMLLHREDYYHENEEGYSPTGVTELIVAKQRNGPTGTVPLVLHREYTRFESAALDSWMP